MLRYWASSQISLGIAREIQFLRTKEFSNVFSGLGGFHLAKEIMACIGEYLRESGAENIFVETETFGPDVAESVLCGKHYSRAMRSFSILAESMQRLCWKAFLENKKFQLSEELITEINMLKDSFTTKNSVKAHEHLTNIRPMLSQIVIEVDKFIAESVNEDETFRYWHQFIAILYPILRDLT